MKSSSIKNVVFDVGNVIVRWSPIEIIRLTFGEEAAQEDLVSAVFQSETWLNLNKGFMSEGQAKSEYQKDLGFTDLECERLFYYIKQTQLLIFGSVELIQRLKKAGYKVYALTDNVHEIVAHLKSTYIFWDLFDGATVSAEVGLLKPQAEIYQSLLAQNQIEASESVFLDDMPANVEGAIAVGLSAIQFKHSAQCEEDLKQLGLTF
ncbi:HAD family phosphatase [uncultured Vibrio sp.]|uniref:HAD family hydrolase n=1 Tax=uncultured Vibrio sp. TaxID=114054 RepID=UPI0025E0FB7F|nr:HAD family phosphatase [uncultured Vibrio sp.]